ncbi:uncharacterized protein EV420DRAFT_1532126 [Desarmillaria tabescens]|uniref:Uncharacterized protein n=1 Tax=Armillaria tabescens TaxID=1929756 RepID=A0AA39N7G6_ARMTA|nr:uncharacterized protein EV420DRAFT_1532126 [Desarmillaria tabescens]KAK0460430.1 hypothetical protein EV420DRAFT_1532126 [Desarmillaria tabescens]
MDVEMLDVSSGAPQISASSRFCASCKKPMPNDALYKSCELCLTKKREYQRRRATERKKQIMAIKDVVGMKRKAEDVVLDANAKKKRVRQILREVQVTDSVQDPVVSKGVSGTFVVQTASDLYKLVKAQPKLVKACHSIISVESIDHQKRTKLVSKDLLSFAGLRFDRFENIFNGIHLPGTYTRIFKCKCQSKEPSKEQEPLKRRASDLSSWVVSSKSKSPEGPCSGRITVVAEDDNSHPLGIPGQKVTVTVNH